MIDDQMRNCPADDNRRRILHVTCTQHGGTPGFTNLAVSKRDGMIELDPHVDRSCVITLGEQSARALCEALTEWLG